MPTNTAAFFCPMATAFKNASLHSLPLRCWCTSFPQSHCMCSCYLSGAIPVIAAGCVVTLISCITSLRAAREPSVGLRRQLGHLAPGILLRRGSGQRPVILSFRFWVGSRQHHEFAQFLRSVVAFVQQLRTIAQTIRNAREVSHRMGMTSFEGR